MKSNSLPLKTDNNLIHYISFHTTVPTDYQRHFREPKKGVTIFGNFTIWVIEGFRIEGIDSSIRIGLFV